MSEYFTLDPKDVVISEEDQQKMKEANYAYNEKKCIAYYKDEQFKPYPDNNKVSLTSYEQGKNPYRANHPENITLTEEKQQEIREIDYIGKKRVIVYHQNEKFEVCNKNNDYYVGNYGKIYNINKNICVPTHIYKDGYERVSIKGKPYTVHRLILENFCPVNNMNNLQVNHINFNKSFNTYNPPINSNLEWTTGLENVRHAVAHGHVGGNPRFGEDNPNCKYTEKEIYKICELLSSNIYTDKQIAEQLGKEYDNAFEILLSNIRHKKRWKNISNNFPNICLRDIASIHREEEIYKICELLSQNYTGKQIAEQLGKEYDNAFSSLLCDIRSKKSWKQISSQFSNIQLDYKQHTEEEIYKICELLSQNYTDRQIAEQLGKEYNNSFSSLLCNIRSKTNWKNISDNFPNICLRDTASIHREEEIWKICELLSQNYTGKQIAEQLGKECNNAFEILLSNIRHKKRWKNISDNFSNIQVCYNKKCNTEEEIYKICELLSQNYTGKQIAEQLGKEYDKKFMNLLYDIKTKTTWKNISDNFANIQQPNCHHYTEEEIYKICELISKGYTGRQIAEEMNIEYTPRFQDRITKIRLGRSWKNISDQFPEIQPKYKWNKNK